VCPPIPAPSIWAFGPGNRDSPLPPPQKIESLQGRDRRGERGWGVRGGGAKPERTTWPTPGPSPPAILILTVPCDCRPGERGARIRRFTKAHLQSLIRSNAVPEIAGKPETLTNDRLLLPSGANKGIAIPP
jgi:hypothetical protein